LRKKNGTGKDNHGKGASDNDEKDKKRRRGLNVMRTGKKR